MYLELPRLRRCCFCLPLRRGLLTVAYVNILYTVAVAGYAANELRSRSVARAQLLLRGNVFDAGCVLLLVLYTLDALFYVILLMGAHKRSGALMRVFLLYGAGSTVVALLANLCLMRRVRIDEFLLLFCGTVLQCYLLVMVRSEILKLKEEDISYSVAHTAADPPPPPPSTPSPPPPTQSEAGCDEGEETSTNTSTEILYDKVFFDTEVKHKSN